MPKYTDSNGNIVSEEQIAQDMAMVEFTDLQTYLDFAGLKLAKENGVAETSASATPDNNQALNQEAADTGSNWDQDSLDTSNTEEAKPIDNVRYIKFKSGAVVYEDEYLDKYAGTERFPASFDDYAAKFKTKPITPSPSNVELDEVVITAEASPEVKNAQSNATNYIQAIDSKNEVTLKGDIGIEYFGLTDEYTGNKYNPGNLIPKSTASADFMNSRPKKNINTWYPETRMKGQYINTLEEDQKASMGEGKWNEWQAILKVAGDTPITKENIAEFIDLAKIDETTKSQVVNTAKNKASELFIYDNDLTETEQEKMLMNLPYSSETKSAMREEVAKRKQDEIDFKNKFGRPLVREETLQGRKYTPYALAMNTGMFDEIIAKENKGLKTDFEVITKDIQNFVAAQDDFVEIRSQQEIKLNNLKNEIDSYSVEGVNFMSPNEVAKRNALITEFNDTLSFANSEAMQSQWKELTASRAELTERSDALTLRSKQLNDLNIGTGAIGKSYELGDQFAQVMEESFLGTSAMLGGSVFKLIGNIATIGKTENEAMQNSFYRDMKDMKMAAVDYNERLQKRRENYLPSRIEWDDKEAGWGDYVSTMLVENSPSILTAMGTLGASSAGVLSVKAATNVGTGIFFVMEAGGQMSGLEIAQRNADEIILSLNEELKTAVGDSERREIQRQIQEQKDILNLSQWKKSLSSLVYGGTAAVAERFGTLNFINNFQKYSRAIGANQFKKLVSDGMARTLAKTTGTIAGVGMGGGIELLEEGFTLIGQNISDVAILKEDKNIFEGLDKDFIANTLATSMAISGPQASQNIYSIVKSEVMSRREAREESKLRDEILGLQNSINGDKLTAEERKRARRKKYELMTELGLQNTEAVLKINDMTAQEFENVTEINREMRALENEASQLGAGGDVSGYALNELKNLKSKYKDLISQREAILERQKNETDKLFDSDGELNVNKQYSAQLFNFAKNIIKNNKGTKSQNFTTSADAIKFIKENHSKWFADLNDQDKKDFESGQWGGLNIGNNIYTNQESVYNDINTGNLRVGQMAAMSPLHELGHIQAVKAGIIKDEKFVGDANAMINGVKQEVANLFNQRKISAEDYKLFQDRMAQYIDANTGQVNADELIQLIGDFTNLGILPRSSFNTVFEIKNFVSNLMKRANGDAEMYFRFNKPENVFGFVNSWTKKAIGGKQLGGIEDKEKGKAKLSKSQVQLEKTKAKFKELESNFQSGAAQNAIASELFNMVDTQISNRFNLRPQVKQDLRDDVIERIYKAQETTKWDGRGSLYGFINGRIAKRILDALRGDQSYLENIDNNQFEQLEKAAALIVEDKPTAQKAKPQYKNLLKSNILSSESIANINSKVLTIVRTLKSKLNEKISNNRTVTPLIAEIKKEMGKQADIDLKKAMGGIKDNAIQKFLTKNKKAILENMTTTWLMGAIPSAVQKQVDGKFISNWKGQKIDRETVGTDNAGRTSGAEITRRKPNVASMPDAEFLSYFIADNTLIRGRKESLAKAMAEEISLEIFNTELQNENSEISKAFEQNQTLKGVELLDNYIVEVAKQTERGNAKFSKSLSANEANIVKSKANQLKNKLIKADVKLTAKRLLPFLIDTYPEIDEKRLKSFATEAIQSIQRYIKKIEITDKVDFGNFIFEGMSLKESNSNLLKFFGFLKNDVESLGALFNNPDLIAEQRGLELSYNTNLILKEGADGLIKILRWGRGHNVTSGKIGGGRNQIYAGNPDYLDNNLNNIPDVEVVYKKGKSTSIKAVFYKGIEVENWKERIQSPAQKPAGGIEGFRKDSQIREDAAREAWTYLTDYLQHVKDNGSKINWVMTMMSLKSNMSSVLKAAAPVKYYFNGNYKGPLRYEHMIPTEYMVLKLTDYYYNGQSFDLNTLRDKYNVAIIPVIMDNNFNILTQSQMNSSFDPMVDSEVDRYFNENTYGYPNMFPIESLTGETKGNIEGETWVKFNNVLKPQAAKMSKSMRIADKAMNAARMPDYSVNPKGISVYDFDDTLAFSKSKIIVTMSDGTVTKITPAEFAAKDEILSEQGASFDFSEFNKVVQGTKGPLAARLEKAIKKFGNKNIYVLTARPQASAPAIYEFLKGIGLEIPLENITGLQDGRPSAKADWMIEKFSEGYNDFYFVDDAYKNVKAVQDVLSVLDVKSKVQQARAKFSRSLSSEFNKMIERNKGVTAEAQFSNAVAKRRGANIGKYRWFIPSSADDFRGLTQYTFAGKGKQGEADQAFFEKALMDPYFAGISAIESSRQMMKNAYANLLKQMKPVRKKLNKLIPDTSYTYDQAIRVYLWNKAGYDIPGLSKRDLKKLLSIINNDSDLSAFADGALLSSKQDQWSEPSEHWQAGTILKDLNELTEKVNRKEYLGEFIANSEILFSPENMNKIEALYGSRHREALEDALYRMRNGTNRPSGGNRLTNAWNNWVNNSVGTIMFFNRRSALLQLLSTVNFINWSDNNPLKASIAFANQPQYWKDWVRIFNSDKLKQRRGGLKSDIQEQEIASQAKNSKDKSSAIIAYLLKIGFTPTQIADSMAIATGGATFYRNRINTYLKQDMSKEEAEAKAWADFSKISDEAQQSGDPALVSQQQASVLGRLVLAFQNTPMQYTRLMKKAGLDIINKRGDFKTNFSKIIYYGAVQNFIFSALQNALFAMIPGFDDEEETEEDKKKKENQKTGRIIHSMVDTILRGSGLAGAVATTAKNTIRKFLEQEEKGFTADHTYTIIEAANISPPIGSKLRKLYGAIQTWKFDKDVVKERGFDVTLNGKLNISPTYNIIGNLSSALVNLPLDRALMEVEGIVEALDERNTLYQRIALALGWRTWGVGAKNEEEDLIKDAAKAKRKEEGKLKAKETRRVNKDALYKLELEIDGDNFIEYYEWKKGKSIKDKIEWLKSKK